MRLILSPAPMDLSGTKVGQTLPGWATPGNGTGSSSLAPNYAESLTSSVVSVSATSDGACAVVNGAGGQPSVQCWNIDRATDSGMQGDGTTGQSLSPFWIFSTN